LTISPALDGNGTVEEAIQILAMAGATFLPDESKWDRFSESMQHKRIKGPVEGRYSLFGALTSAGEEVTGVVEDFHPNVHRHIALQAVRCAVKATDPKREWKHELCEFNAEQSFSDIKAVIASALTTVRSHQVGK
jgi:hypothetical protein